MIIFLRRSSLGINERKRYKNQANLTRNEEVMQVVVIAFIVATLTQDYGRLWHSRLCVVATITPCAQNQFSLVVTRTRP